MKTLEHYANQINIPVHTIKGTTRKQEVAIARAVYWRYLNRKGLKMVDIAAMFNRKAHSTISSGIKRAENLISCNDEIAVPFLKAVDP